MFKRLFIAVLFAMVSHAGMGAPLSFELTDMAGAAHSLDIHHGKWTLVNLWATWCPPCLSEMPELESLSKARADLVVIGVAVDGQNAERIRQFADKLRISYPIVAGNAEAIRQFKPKGYPTSLLFDESGHLVYLKQGTVTRAEVESLLLRSAGAARPISPISPPTWTTSDGR
jgi:thiol-disulfide isomerase/thioredoxin